VRPASAGQFDYVATVNPSTAKAISASLHLPSSEAAVRMGMRTGHQRAQAAAPVQHGANRAPVSPEKAQQQLEKRSPAVVNASIRGLATPSFFYVVTQTERVDGLGNVVVTTAVWRIRVVKPAPARAQNIVVSHQT